MRRGSLLIVRRAAAVALVATTAIPGIAGPAADALPPLAPGQSLGIALGISAVPNLRDIGGYKTRDGAIVARGLVFRSGMFDPIGSEDIKKLERLELRNDYDLRTDTEARARPDEMPSGVRYALLNVLADADSAAPAQIEALLHDPQKANATLGGGRIDAMFMQAYRGFVSLPSASRSYRTLFLSLTDRSKLPAVFHCTGGKDRTGWAAAALLTLLGVPQEMVIADFLRSNEYLLPQYQRAIDGFIAAGGDRTIPLAVFGAKAEYLQASFDEMQKRYGTIERYFSDALGIDAAGQRALRDLYLERQ